MTERGARRYGWLWALVAALLCICGYLLFHSTFRKVEEEQIVGYRGPALRDPWYLLRAFLEEAGYTQSEFTTFAELPPEGVALFWLSDQPPPATYLDWIGGGGHLVVDADPFYDMPDASGLFDQLTGRGAPVVHHQYQYGDGCVTVLHDFGWLANARFPDSKGPEQLLTALEVTDWVRHVVLYSASDPPWFGTLLVRRAWPALAGGLVAIFLLLWHAAGAFGPPLPPPELARRSMLEHLRAVGQLAVRTDSVEALCTASRHELQKRLARRYPMGAELPENRRIERLAALTQLPASVVRDAMFEPTGRQPARWVRIARAQQQLWRLS